MAKVPQGAFQLDLENLTGPASIFDRASSGGNRFAKYLKQAAPAEKPSVGAEFIKGLQDVPESVSRTLGSVEQYIGTAIDAPELAERGRARMERAISTMHQPAVPSIDQAEGLLDHARFLAYQIPTQAPSLGASLLAAGGGAAVGALGGPVGVAAGGTIGGGLASAILNGAEVFEQMKARGVDDATALEHAGLASVPMAVLDTILPAKIAGRIVGARLAAAAAREAGRVQRNLARRVGTEFAKGALTEAPTEATQELIGAVATNLAADAPELLTREDLIQAAGAAAVGGALGGLAGGAAGVMPDPRPGALTPPPEAPAPLSGSPSSPTPAPTAQPTVTPAPGPASAAPAAAPSVGPGEKVRATVGGQTKTGVVDAVNMVAPDDPELGGQPTPYVRIKWDDGTVFDDALDALPDLAKATVGTGTKDDPVRVETPADVTAGAERTADPTPAQAVAGNYRKRHVKWQGLGISIETEKGQKRSGTAPDGTDWEVEMPVPYGYFLGTEGADGDHLDVYLGPNPESPHVFVIDQIDPARDRFDEHKVMAAFPNMETAAQAYSDAFSDGSGPNRAGAITQMSVSQFKTWLKNLDTKKPLAWEPKGALEAEPEEISPEQSQINDLSPERPPEEISPEPAAVSPTPDTSGVVSSEEVTRDTQAGLEVRGGVEVGQAPVEAPEPRGGGETAAAGGILQAEGQEVAPPAAEEDTGRPRPDDEDDGGLTHDERVQLEADAMEEAWAQADFDFVSKFPTPNDEQQHAAGRRGILDETDDITHAEEVLRDIHEETFNSLAADMQALDAIDAAERNGVDPHTGKPPRNTPDAKAKLRETINRLRREHQRSIDDTLAAYIDHFGEVAAFGFEQFVRTNYRQGYPGKEPAADAADDADAGTAAPEAEENQEPAPDETPATPEPDAAPEPQAPADELAALIEARDQQRSDAADWLVAQGYAKRADDEKLTILPKGRRRIKELEEAARPTPEAEPETPPAEPEAPADTAPEATEPRKKKLQDVGEKMAGKRARRSAKEEIADARVDDVHENLTKILDLTSRSRIWPIEPPEDAKPGVRVYLARVRDSFKPFIEVIGGEAGGGRGKWQRSFTEAVRNQLAEGFMTIEQIEEKAADYIEFFRHLADLTADSKTSLEAAGKMQFAFFEGGEPVFSKLTDLGKQGREYSRHLLADLTLPNGKLLRSHDDNAIPDDGKKQLVRPRSKLEDIQRTGLPDYRKGKDVDAEDFRTTFGFRGVEFGEWVNAKERQLSVNHAYDALMDLATMLGIKPIHISLGGRLGLAFGSRGHGRHAAHYEPGNKVINLTKTSGDGSLAHEWMHALEDALIANGGSTPVNDLRAALQYRPNGDRALTTLDGIIKGHIWIRGAKRRGPAQTAREYVELRWKQRGWSGVDTTQFKKDADALGKEYWGKPEELVARAFEAAAYDKIEGSSPYLVNSWVADGHVTKDAGYRGRPYPAGDERQEINRFYDHFLAGIEWSDDGPRMRQDYELIQPARMAEVQRLLDEAWKRAQNPRDSEEAEDGAGTGEVGEPGQGPLEGVPADEVSEPGEGGDAGSGGAGRGAADGEGGGRTRGRGGDDGGSLSGGEGEVSVPTGGAGPDGGTAGERRPGGYGRDGEDAPGEQRGLGTPPGSDYVITEKDRLGQGGQGEKVRDNIAAIRLLKQLEAEGRRATPEEQAVLVRYVGWGGLKSAFPNREVGTGAEVWNRGWEKIGAELKALLTPEEYETAQRSVLDAHYTSETVVRAMYDAVGRLGFKAGAILEPSVGTGNFFGLMPEGMRARSSLTGVELDHITGGIAKQLYQTRNILAPMGFQDAPLADNHFDLAIGNPPFGAQQVPGAKEKDIRDFSIHNYFFARTINKVRPGGIVAMVVTHRYLDKPGGKQREYVAHRAKFLGAIRLPNTAFKQNAGTEVTTDIVFLQKLPEKEWGTADDAWTQVGEIPDPLGGDPIPLNKWFIEHPDMMLGRMDRSGTMRGKNEPTLAPDGRDLATALAEAIQNLPENVYIPAWKGAEQIDEMLAAAAEPSPAASDYDIGSYFLDNGRLMRRVESPDGSPMAAEVTAATQWSEKQTLGENRLERLKGLVQVRDAARELLRAEAGNTADRFVEELRKRLNTVYDAFQKKHGYLNDAGNERLFKDDPDAPLLLALEDDHDKGISPQRAKTLGVQPRKSSAKKAAIFRQRVIPRHTPVTKADSAEDALAITLNERGRVDLEHMAELTGKSQDELIEELHDKPEKPLIFQDPDTLEWQTAEVFLSGNVKAKERAARAAGMKKAADALRAIFPRDLKAGEITVRLGAHWIDRRYYEDFARHILGEGTLATIGPVPATGGFYVNVSAGSEVNETNRWGTPSFPASRLLEALLNGRSIVVYDKLDDGTRVVDQEATAAALEKAQAIKDEFSDWIFKDAARREHLTAFYNEHLNNTVEPRLDGSHLTLPGKVPDSIIKLRRHQNNAIWRGIQTRRVLLDHVVGAGKTFTIVATAMELRRMGLAKKPMIVVPNHLVEQWATDFYKLYPGAKILTMRKKDFEAKNRRRMLGKIATGDWDAVIIAHSSFGFIKTAPEHEAEFMREMVAELQASIDMARALDPDKKNRTVAQLEKSKQNMLAKIKKLLDTPRDNLLTFEELGVDQLFVDESHEFKNLFFTTSRRGMLGLGNPEGSQKAFGLFVKAQLLLRQQGQKGVIFATGTPVSNSLSELYTIQRYLGMPELQRLGILSFDGWLNTFGDAHEDYELDGTGVKYKQVNRLRGLHNLPEVMALYRQYADSVTLEQIKAAYREDNPGKEFPIPKVKGGKRTNVVVPRSAAQAAFFETIVERAENLNRHNRDNMLAITTDARKAALDMRLVDRDAAPDPEGKVAVAADRIYDIWRRWEADRGTQLVFLDLSIPLSAAKKESKDIEALIAAAQAGDEDAQEALDKINPDDLEALRSVSSGFSVYDELKEMLVKRGIPANEIAFIHDANTDAKKDDLFEQVNAGRVRILMGSTAKMGAGTNVQKRVVALHHLDCPWRPSDIEQREGRVIRQGNELFAKYGDKFEVEIIAYATEQTYDARMWQTQEQKLLAIEGLRNFAGEREMEEVAAAAATAAEMKAAASGNPLILEDVQLAEAIRKLETAQRAHRSNQHDLEDTKRRHERLLADAPERLEKEEADAKKARAYLDKPLGDNPPSGTVDGKTYTSFKEALEAAEASVARQTEGAKEGSRPKYTVEINGEKLSSKEKIAVAIQKRWGDANPIKVTIEGNTFISRQEIAQAMVDKFLDALPSRPVEIKGEIAGLPMTIEASIEKFDMDAYAVASVDIGDKSAYRFHVTGKSRSISMDPEQALALGRQVVRHLNGAMEEIAQRPDDLKHRVEVAKRELAEIATDLGKPFPREQELQEKKKRHAEVRRLLSAKDNTESQPREFRSGRDEGGQDEVIVSDRMNDFRDHIAEAGAADVASMQKVAGDYVLKRGELTGWEYLAAVDAVTGAAITATTSHNGVRVAASDAFFDEVMKPDAAIVVHHSHPERTYPLSDSDLRMLSYPGLLSIFAHTRIDGERQYFGAVLKRGFINKALQAAGGEKWGSAHQDKIRDFIADAFIDASHATDKYLGQEIVAGRLTDDQAEVLLQHNIAEALARFGVINYFSSYEVPAAQRGVYRGITSTVAAAVRKAGTKHGLTLEVIPHGSAPDQLSGMARLARDLERVSTRARQDHRQGSSGLPDQKGGSPDRGSRGPKFEARGLRRFFGPETNPIAAREAAGNDLRRLVTEAFTGVQPAPGVTVQRPEPAGDVPFFMKLLATPELIFRKYEPALYRVWRQISRLNANQSKWVRRYRKQASEITSGLSTEQIEQTGHLLFLGDALEREFSRTELERGFYAEDDGTQAPLLEGVDKIDAKVVDAYIAMRRLIEQIGRQVDMHERKMLPTYRARKETLVRKLARFRQMSDADFRKLFTKVSDLLSRYRRAEYATATGEDATTLAAAIEAAEREIFGRLMNDDGTLSEPAEQFIKDYEELKQIDAKLQATSIRRRKGYFPHKFFGSWAVYEVVEQEKLDENGHPELDKKGRPVIEEAYRLIAHEKNGFYTDVATATRAANAYAANNPGARIVARPVAFKFPNAQATELSDAAYYRFLNNISATFEMTLEEAREQAQGVARRRFRRRIAGFKQFRQGIEGYSRNFSEVLDAHIGEAMRYVTMDEAKYLAISAIERLGLSERRSTVQERPVLSALVNQWFRDINGQKQTGERFVDEIFDKPWATPVNSALAAGGTAFLLSGGLTGNPLVGALIGSYVGYRFYRGVKEGGDFKSRAITGAMLEDMAHLKLGAFFNLFSPLVNLSQTLTNTVPVLGAKYTGIGMKRYMAAMALRTAHSDAELAEMRKAGRGGQALADLTLIQRADIDTAYKASELSPHLFVSEPKWKRASLFFFNQAEMLNRGVAYLGAVAKAEDQGMTPGAAKRYAENVMLRTQFDYSNVNKPELLRNVFLRVPGQFKNFVSQQLAFIFGLDVKTELPKFLFSLFLIAGFIGLPFLDLLDELIQALTDESPLTEVKRQVLLAQAEGGLSGTMATFFARGIPGLLGVDLSSRAGMEKFLPMEARDWAGPWWTTLSNAAAFGEQNATVVDQIRNLSTGIGAPLKAIEASANGMPLFETLLTDPRALVAAFGDDRATVTNPWLRGKIEYEPTTAELALKAIGGSPLREAQMRDIRDVVARRTEQVKAGNAETLDAVVAAVRDGSPAEIRELLLEAAAEGRPLTLAQIKNALRNAGLTRMERLIKQSPKVLRPEVLALYRAVAQDV